MPITGHDHRACRLLLPKPFPNTRLFAFLLSAVGPARLRGLSRDRFQDFQTDEMLGGCRDANVIRAWSGSANDVVPPVVFSRGEEIHGNARAVQRKAALLEMESLRLRLLPRWPTRRPARRAQGREQGGRLLLRRPTLFATMGTQLRKGQGPSLWHLPFREPISVGVGSVFVLLPYPAVLHERDFQRKRLVNPVCLVDKVSPGFFKRIKLSLWFRLKMIRDCEIFLGHPGE
jgi:hypothetical protein